MTTHDTTIKALTLLKEARDTMLKDYDASGDWVSEVDKLLERTPATSTGLQTDPGPYYTIQMGAGSDVPLHEGGTGPDEPIWYFNLLEQFDKAFEGVSKHGLQCVIDEVAAMPEGEMVSDAAEFIDYLNLDYVMNKPDLHPLTPRQRATVLAALRFYQHSGLLPQPGAQWLKDIATNNGAVEPLDADEIDTLFEDLN